MLSYEDVIALCELTEDEVRAIAEHEHLPDIVAAELGYCLATREDGGPTIRRILLDDVEAAERRGDAAAALRYREILERFTKSYPRPGPLTFR